MILNDLQSRLNETNVLQISAPGDIDEVALTITDASNTNTPISVAGALHSMGGQQFADASISLSSRNINKLNPWIRKDVSLSCNQGLHGLI